MFTALYAYREGPRESDGKSIQGGRKGGQTWPTVEMKEERFTGALTYISASNATYRITSACSNTKRPLKTEATDAS